MRFKILNNVPDGASAEEAVILIPSDWDDYSYRTKFGVYVAQANGPFDFIGETKVLAHTYAEDSDYKRTKDLMDADFETLGPNQFCSLGQDSSYYERLGQLPPKLGHRILQALNDVNFAAVEPWWTNVPGFDTSLLRVTSAHLARRDAKSLFDGLESPEEYRHQIRFPRSGRAIDGGPDMFEASFDGKLAVPGRVNVVVGRNGTGKTSLLANLALWFSKPYSRNKFEYRPEFSRILVVTFNVFDSAYRVPQDSEANVRFVGRTPMSSRTISELKSLSEMDAKSSQEEWTAALLKAFPGPAKFQTMMSALVDERQTIDVLEKLRHDSEWKKLIDSALEDTKVSEALLKNPSQALDDMSAGQKVLVKLYAALFANLDRCALVLIDEPENYLHPSLIARFVRTLNKMLNQRRAYAILATHSPVIVQETPSRFVTVLERNGNTTTARCPNFETFGESIDNITERLFDTDFNSSHWKSVLRGFAKKGYDVDAVAKEVSNKPLPLLARTYFAYYRRGSGG